jgi:hypothetical protein
MKYNIGIVPPTKGKPVGSNCGTTDCCGTKMNEPKVWSIEMILGKSSIFMKIICWNHITISNVVQLAYYKWQLASNK